MENGDGRRIKKYSNAKSVTVEFKLNGKTASEKEIREIKNTKGVKGEVSSLWNLID